MGRRPKVFANIEAVREFMSVRNENTEQESSENNGVR